MDVAREAIAAGDVESAPARADALKRTLLQPVINATGVILHTNLGRAPLAVDRPAVYTNLELDLATGRRGSRLRHVGDLLARACGAAAAIVVNNGAAAVLLALATLAKRRPVIVSRGELVEIGGGFRVPEVLAQSGARLVEVGATNRTRLADYQEAFEANPTTAAILKVHQSNYRIVGFTEHVEVDALAGLGPPVLADIGSGVLDATTPWLPGGPPLWIRDEPAARQTLEAGAALVAFSADKVLGGPQAGILAGRADLVARCARHPLARALRPGGLVLGVLQDVVLIYLERRAVEEIPFWRMVVIPLDDLLERARAMAVGEIVPVESLPGAGAAPGLTIPSIAIAIPGDHGAALRRASPPIIARVMNGSTICDLRTVDPRDDAVLAKALQACMS